MTQPRAQSQPRTTFAGVRRAEGSRLERALLSPAGLLSVAVSALSMAGAAALAAGPGLSSEAEVRTAHLVSLLAGYEPTALAFGMERPPLPALLGLPFAAVPALRSGGLAVALGVALAGGLSVAVANGVAGWAGFGRRARVLFVSAFALHPLLVISSAAGLPEALYATLLLAAFGQFLRWLDRETTAPLILTGVALGVAFLLRYDVVWVVAVSAACIYAVARTREQGYENSERAQATTIAFAVPVLFIVGFWVLTSWFAQGELFEFLRSAGRVSALAAGSDELAAQRGALAGDAPGVVRWAGTWALAVAPLSVLAVGGLVGYAILQRERTALALAAALASIALPPLVSMLAGHGQPHVPHLFALAVPAHVVIAYAERQRTAGRAPVPYERGARRRQLAFGLVLAAGAAASLVALPGYPEADRPFGMELARPTSNVARAADADATATARWLRTNAGPGEVIVDLERSAAVYLATGRPHYFRTPQDVSGPAVIANPGGIASYLLMRAPVAGAAGGAIERAYPTLWAEGAAGFDLAFEAGPYRVYRLATASRENTPR